jgi:hypothetical protein
MEDAMRRTAGLCLALIALLAAGPSFAGMRAVYHGETEPKVLEVETGDAGELRIGKPGDPAYAIERDGRFYMVQPGPDGQPLVFAVEDMAAVLGKSLPPLFATLFSEAARANPSPPPQMERLGSRTVAGFPGEVWKVTLNGNPPNVQELVFSSDPALKPVGRALGRFLESMMLMATPLLGEMAGEMAEEMRSVFAVGTPLESVGRFRLVEAKAADIPAERFQLPARPATRAEIEAEVKRSAPPSP